MEIRADEEKKLQCNNNNIISFQAIYLSTSFIIIIIIVKAEGSRRGGRIAEHDKVITTQKGLRRRGSEETDFSREEKLPLKVDRAMNE